jgi:HAD superfamily hydrolase (TIGR01490 family)
MNSKQKFAVFDIDGTLIRRQLYHKLVNRLAHAGALGKQAPRMVEEAEEAWKRRKFSDFAFERYDDTLVQLYEDALQNISPKLFDELVIEVIEKYKDQAYAYTTQLFQDLKAAGYKLFIISGSHMELIEQIAKYYGFDDWMGTYYERGENGFTGEVGVSTLNKETSLKKLLERHTDVTLEGSICIGDTKSDIPMLKMVEKPIAFNPDKKLYNFAREQGWKIVIERKNVIYELESKDGSYTLTP